jgi:hypothetical protein
MSLRKLALTVLFMVPCFVVATTQPVVAQAADQPSQNESKVDETNLDTHLYLLLASNQDVGDEKVPSALEPVLKQLRASLPFKNYRLAATLINRVKNEGRLNLKWVGGTLLPSAAARTHTPSFNDFRINRVMMVRDADGQQMIRMEGFGFGARIPITTAAAVAANAPPVPIINYEPTGLNTDFSMREGEPVVVGTLNLGPSGDAIILVMSARRSGK